MSSLAVMFLFPVFTIAHETLQLYPLWGEYIILPYLIKCRRKLSQLRCNIYLFFAEDKEYILEIIVVYALSACVPTVSVQI